MHTIDVDFDVFKALTLRRPSADVTENDVLRELLGLPTKRPSAAMVSGPAPGDWVTKGVRFPAGTEFRSHYRGQTHLARARPPLPVRFPPRHNGRSNPDLKWLQAPPAFPSSQPDAPR